MSDKLLNYTTQIPEEKTIGEIESLLASMGANKVMKEYDGGGHPTALSFMIHLPEGEVPFRLPMNVLAVQQTLKNQYKNRHGREGRGQYSSLEQARRTGWRIVLRWVEAQLAIIKTEMVTVEQVFLPYIMVDSTRTLYDAYTEQPNKFRLLAGKPDGE